MTDWPDLVLCGLALTRHLIFASNWEGLADAEPPLLVTTMVTSPVELLCFLLFFSFRRTSACRTRCDVTATALFVLC